MGPSAGVCSVPGRGHAESRLVPPAHPPDPLASFFLGVDRREDPNGDSHEAWAGRGLVGLAHAVWGRCSFALRGQRQKGLLGPGEGGSGGPGLPSAGALSCLHAVRAELVGARPCRLHGASGSRGSACPAGSRAGRGLFRPGGSPPLVLASGGSWLPRPAPPLTRWHALGTGCAKPVGAARPSLLRLPAPACPSPRVCGLGNPGQCDPTSGVRLPPAPGPRVSGQVRADGSKVCETPVPPVPCQVLPGAGQGVPWRDGKRGRAREGRGSPVCRFARGRRR